MNTLICVYACGCKHHRSAICTVVLRFHGGCTLGANFSSVHEATISILTLSLVRAVKKNCDEQHRIRTTIDPGTPAHWSLHVTRVTREPYVGTL
eukprot:COSAG01_NODE_6038_length_3885_cov_4.682250_2_plen_94_part_00